MRRKRIPKHLKLTAKQLKRGAKKPEQAKRGPKQGVSKWRWYVIQRLRDGQYFAGYDSHYRTTWTGEKLGAAQFKGVVRARATVGVLEARREKVRKWRQSRVHWRIEDINDPTWNTIWPW